MVAAFVWLVVAGCGLCSACTAPSQSTAPSAAPSQKIAPPPCEMLTAAQVSDAFGGRAAHARNTSPIQCQWWLDDAVTYMTLDRVMSSTLAEARGQFQANEKRETNAQYSTSIRSEPGIGEDAFSAYYSNYRAGFGREVLFALKGSYLLTLNLVDRAGDTVMRARVEAVAREALILI